MSVMSRSIQILVCILALPITMAIAYFPCNQVYKLMMDARAGMYEGELIGLIALNFDVFVKIICIAILFVLLVIQLWFLIGHGEEV